MSNFARPSFPSKEDNSEYAQEEDPDHPDHQWEWDEDAPVWISASVAKGKGSPKSYVKCHLCGRRGHMARQSKADMSKVKCFHCPNVELSGVATEGSSSNI